MSDQDGPSLHYFQDTLCGWCYGFGPVIQRIADEWSAQLPTLVYAGGMIVGSSVAPIERRATYIESAYKDVERLTGIVFGDAFVDHVLKDGTMVLDSETPARALVSMRAFRPELALPFSHALQCALYRDGLDLSMPDTYRTLAQGVGIDGHEFLAVMESDDVRAATLDEFSYVAELGIGGFPTVVLAVADEAHVIAQGFRPYEQLNTSIRELLVAG